MSLCIDCCVNLKVKSCLWKLLPVIGTSITSAKWTPAASRWSTDGQIQSGSQECHSADHSPAASQSPCCPGTLFISFFLLSRSVCVYLLKKLNGFFTHTCGMERTYTERLCVFVCLYICHRHLQHAPLRVRDGLFSPGSEKSCIRQEVSSSLQEVMILEPAWQ